MRPVFLQTDNFHNKICLKFRKIISHFLVGELLKGHRFDPRERPFKHILFIHEETNPRRPSLFKNFSLFTLKWIALFLAFL